MNKEPLVKEVSINAPASRVWKAITSKEEMKSWSFDIKEFEPVPGFEFRFEGGKDGQVFVHICTVKEAIENKKFSYTWTYQNFPGIETLVTIELFEDSPNLTRVRLTHEGLEQFPQDNNFARNNFDMGWTSITKMLKEHVEQA